MDDIFSGKSSSFLMIYIHIHIYKSWCIIKRMKYLTSRSNQSQICHHVLRYIEFEERQYRNSAILKQKQKK